MYNYQKKLKDLLTLLVLSIITINLFAQEINSVDVVSPNKDSIVVEEQKPDTIVVAPQGSNPGLRITGTVTDASTGLPIPAISVTVPLFSTVLTDDNGAFSLRVPNYQVSFMVTGMGYQSKEVPIKGRHEVKVIIHQEEFNSVYDLAYLPYAQRPKNHVVQSAVSLGISNKWETSAETPENLIQGKISGLNVIRRSGTQGIGSNLFLRGFSSLHASNQPLVIVDGVIFDMNDYGGSLIGSYFNNPLENIELKDIDNITVIKDAASIYGSKAANGVILIRTGHAKELATKIDFSTYGGINFAPASLPVMNSSDYRIYLADGLKSKGYSDAYIQAQPYMNDDVNSAGYYRYHNNTNWQDKIFENSYSQNYYMKIAGGDNIASYALSLGYLNHGGTVNNSNLERYNTRFNADLSISPKLTANTSLAFTFSERNLKDDGINIKTNPIYLAQVKAPFMTTNDISDEGILSPNLAHVDLFNVGNPVAVADEMSAINRNYRFFGSVNFTYQFNRYLTLSTLNGVTYDKIRESIFIPRIGIVADTLFNAIAENKMKQQVQRLFSTNSDTRLSYNRTFNRIHGVEGNLGFRYNGNRSEGDYGLGFNSASDQLRSVGTGVNRLRQVGGEIGKWKWMSYYLGLDYNLMKKYYLSFNMSLDGSSRFGDKIDDPLAVTMFSTKFGLFPSIGGAWIVSSENFMSNLNFIELLKLRATYGITGNDDIGNYTAQQNYVSQNLLGVQGLIRGNVANPKLQWETNKKINAGVDVSFLNELISLSVDVYQNTTSNMITYEPAPSFTGFEYIITNNGAMENKGIELALNSRIVNSKDFKWDMGFNIATYKNKITQFPDDRMITSFAGANILTQVGKPAGVFWGYKTQGVYSSDEEARSAGNMKMMPDGSLVPFGGGDVRFVDTNSDLLIDESDMAQIGDPNPDFIGMFSNRFEWKGISVDGTITFSSGNDIYNYTRANLESMQGFENQTEGILNRWRANGQVTDVPKVSWGDPMGNSSFSDRWIEDGSYLRLRTLSVKYRLPIRTAFLQDATVFLTGNNLLTVTNYLGYDPEFSASQNVLSQGIDIGVIPQFKSVLLGIRIGL